MKLRHVSAGAGALSELTGLAGLYLSHQVARPLLILPLAGLIAYALGLRLGNRPLLLLTALAAAAALAAGFAGGAENTLLLTRTLVGIHAMLWMAARPGEYRYYRLGLAFLELVTAAILAPETYMLGLIFVFAVVGALAFAFGFVERTFAGRGPAALNEPVRPAVLAGIAAVAVGVFLLSFVIFPLLPRSNWDQRNFAETGYTELVSFQSATLGWAGENTRPVLWIFRPAGTAWPDLIPLGLLRAKVLESFDGTNWRPASKHYAAHRPAPAKWNLRIFREPLATEVLPAPYGTSLVAVGENPRPRYGSGEFTFVGAQKKRFEYRAELGPSLGLAAAGDDPRPVHRQKASAETFPRLKALAAEIGRGAANDKDRLRRATSYFYRYRASQGAVGAAGGKVHPVEEFLFETKEGHCELFGTAAALLLREMGVPTRLVAGFRVSMPEEAEVLTVRAGQAHAWVEAYVNGRWVPFDPTPQIMSEDFWPEALTGAYDALNAYWHRYIIGYEVDPAAVAAAWQTARPRLAEAAGAALLILAVFLARRAWRGWRAGRGGRARAARFHRELTRLELSARPALEARYEELRFGREEPSPAALEEFRAALKRHRRPGA